MSLTAEQRMIESLAEHGVDPADLVPALMATHTVNNPDFDPAAKKKAEMEADRIEEEGEMPEEESAPPPPYRPSTLPALPALSSAEPAQPISVGQTSTPHARPTISLPPTRKKSINPFGSDDEDDDTLPTPLASSSRLSPAPTPTRSSIGRLPSYELDDEDGGDIGRTASPAKAQRLGETDVGEDAITPTASTANRIEDEQDAVKDPEGPGEGESQGPVANDEETSMAAPLPSLPGVSTSLSTTDEKVTLDIRWTVVSSRQ